MKFNFRKLPMAITTPIHHRNELIKYEGGRKTYSRFNADTARGIKIKKRLIEPIPISRFKEEKYTVN